MSPALDIDFYPHIFDAILENASHDALLSLRAASRELRRRADMRLSAGHIAITHTYEEDGVVVITSACGQRIPAFASWGQAILGKGHDPYVRLDSIYDDEGRRAADVLRHTEVVDVIGGYKAAAYMPDLRSLVSPNVVLRFLHDALGDRYFMEEPFDEMDPTTSSIHKFAPCDVVVYFLTLPHLRWSFFGRCKAKRVVVNISVHPHDFVAEEGGGATELPEYESVTSCVPTEIVWVFSSALEATGLDSGYLDMRRADIEDCNDMLLWVIVDIVNHARTGSATTVVSIDTLRTMLDRTGVHLTREEQFRALYYYSLPYTRPDRRYSSTLTWLSDEELQAQIAQLEFNDEDDEILDQIEFLTFDEYCDAYYDELGPERLALETRFSGKWDDSDYAGTPELGPALAAIQIDVLDETSESGSLELQSSL